MEYLKKFYKSNKIPANADITNYIIPTTRYLKDKVITCSYLYRQVFENRDRGETLSIKGFYDIRDKVMGLMEIPMLKIHFEDYLDRICETIQTSNELFLKGDLHSRFRYIALHFAQLGGYVLPSQFDIKTVEGVIVPGEPVASIVDKLTVDVLYEFTLIENKDDYESLGRLILSLMVYLVIFRVKTEWDENRNI